MNAVENTKKHTVFQSTTTPFTSLFHCLITLYLNFFIICCKMAQMRPQQTQPAEFLQHEEIMHLVAGLAAQKDAVAILAWDDSYDKFDEKTADLLKESVTHQEYDDTTKEDQLHAQQSQIYFNKLHKSTAIHSFYYQKVKQRDDITIQENLVSLK